MKKFLLIGIIIFGYHTLSAQVPVISSFTPESGAVGTSVVISGSNFNGVAISNIVYFGSAKATVTAAGSTSLTVTVPVGATYQLITVTTNNLTAYSAKPFLVTFPTTYYIDAASFEVPVTFVTNTTPGGVIFGNFAGDVKADLAVATGSPSAVSIFENISAPGGITTGSLITSGDLPASNIPVRVASGDIDGDGDLDLVETGGTGFTVFENIGGGNFNEAYTNFSVAGNPSTVAVADMDKDGKPDIIIGKFSASGIQVFRNIGSGAAFDFDAGYFQATGTNPAGLAIMDLDADGDLDVVVACQGGSISIVKNTTVTGFTFLRTDVSTTGQPSDIGVADFNNDGKLDIAIVSANKPSATVYLNNGIAALSSSNFPSGLDLTASAANTQKLAVGDMDGDGSPDIVATSSGKVSILRNTTANSATTATFETHVDFLVSSGPNLALGDVDGDGKVDMVISNQTNNSLQIFRNTPVPIVSSLSSRIGIVGSPVTITGANFSLVPAENVVSFNGTTAIVTANTLTSLTTSVPLLAATGEVLVTVGGQPAALTNRPIFTVVPPRVYSHIAQTYIDLGSTTGINVSAKLNGNGTAIKSANILYRSIAGGGGYLTAAMTNGSDTTYTGTIPAAAATELGVEYKIVVKDKGDNENTATQDLYKVAIGYPDLGETAPSGMLITSYPDGASGRLASNYRIIAFPLKESRTVSDVCNDVMGPYDNSKYRMFKYNGTTFDELNDASVLTSGVGYWFIKEPSSPIYTGPGTTVDVTTASPFVLTLKNGWNQIGNPYNFKISWTDVIAANPSIPADDLGTAIRVFRGGELNQDEDVLNSLEGGFVLYSPEVTGTTTPLKIPVTKNTGINGRKAPVKERVTNSLDQPSWEILLDLKAGDARSRLGGLGMHPEAREGFDHRDKLNAPRFMEYLQVKFPKSYSHISLTKDVVPTTENYTWSFSVESNVAEEHTSMSWDNSYFGDAKEIYLLDVATHRATDMRSQDHYDFNRGVSKDFRVIFGNSDYVKNNLIPDRVVLYDPYPNPFQDQVVIEFALPKEAEETAGEIEIFDGIGAKVSSMNTPKQSGIVRWVWESESQAQGIYVVRLKVGNQVVMKKLLKR